MTTDAKKVTKRPSLCGVAAGLVLAMQIAGCGPLGELLNPPAPGVMEELLRVNPEDWKAEANDIEAFFDSLGPRMPWELRNELEALRHRLGAQ